LYRYMIYGNALAEMCNRLAATLKLEGLPNLLFRKSGTAVGGQQIEFGDNTQGYGIPGLPGISTGGPGPGSGLKPTTESKLQSKTGDDAGDPGRVGIPNLPELALNDGQQRYGIPGLPGLYPDAPGTGLGMTPPSSPDPAFDPRTVDVNHMTPQQAADMAEYISTLPPEAQQRLMVVARNGGIPPQQAPTAPAAGSAPVATPQVSGGAVRPESAPVVTPQAAAQPVASLRQLANAS
jgi:hypothetical protein